MNHLRLIIFLSIATLFSLFVASDRATPVAAKVSATATGPMRFLSLASLHGSSSYALQAASKPATSDDPLPEGKGKDVTKRLCSTCHGLNTFAKEHHTEEQWGAILDAMVGKGMEASDDDLDTITRYLTTYLGPTKQDAPNSPPGTPSSH